MASCMRNSNSPLLLKIINNIVKAHASVCTYACVRESPLNFEMINIEPY
jgi:hypothetical protein